MQIFQPPKAKDTFGKNSFGLEATSQNWLSQKAANDRKLWGIPDEQKDVWIVQNKKYNLSKFIEKHPGGAHWIEQTKGHDITEHFHIHHLNEKKARQVLEKYYTEECSIKNTRFTFYYDGLYHTIKKRIMQKFTAQQLEDSSQTKILGNIFLVLWLISFIMAGYFQSYIFAAICGIFLFPLNGIAHNFVHKKPTFYRFLYLTAGFSHKQWEIQHCISHHAYTNTLLDYQIRAFEPLVNFLHLKPENKLWIQLPFSALVSMISVANIMLKTIIVPIMKLKLPQWLYFIPVCQIPALYLLCGDLKVSLGLFLGMQITFGIIFYNVILCQHRSQKLWYEGQKQIFDFAEHVIASTLDVEVKQAHEFPFFAFLFHSGFNLHNVHHLFPTIDFIHQRKVHNMVKAICQQFQVKIRQTSGEKCRDSIRKNLVQRVPYSAND